MLDAHPAVWVTLVPPAVEGRFRWEAETAGAITVLLEAGLLDLTDVVVQVSGRPVPPGVVGALGDDEERWTLTLEMGDDPDSLEVELELCPPTARRCVATSATARREAPELAMPELLRFCAAALDRTPAPGAAAAWSQPPSQDPYAVLMLGRAAATWYGLLPSSPPEAEGDRARDPLARAVYIDPAVALAQWLVGRRHAGAQRWSDARVSFTAARGGRPFHPGLSADEAAALGKDGALRAAADAWDGVCETTPEDPRFVLEQARATLAAGRLELAGERLDALARVWPEDPRIARARVERSEALGTPDGYDVLLATWQLTDPADPEPVLRRIHLRIRRGAYEQAWELLPPLRERGATEAADRLTMSLGTALGKAQAAAVAAEALGLPEVALRLLARAALEVDPAADVSALAALTDPEATVARGRAALARNDAEGALVLARATTKAKAWHPGALALEADALWALGRKDEASEAASRLATADPAPSR